MGSSLSARLREARHPHGDSSGGVLAPHEEIDSDGLSLELDPNGAGTCGLEDPPNSAIGEH
jgi:hypothetical protein